VKDSVSKAPVDNDTVFEAASISKTVFAYAVMKLIEKGVIGLDTPLTKYSEKPFLEGDPRLELITARLVLSHRTGFQNWRSDTNPLKINFTPGEKYGYSGEGYSYLQSVVTHLTRQPIEAWMKSNIFGPFGMTSSGYVWSDLFEKRAARPHDRNNKPWDNQKRTASDAARYAAAGDLHTTPTDYAKFLIEILDPKPSDAFRLNAASLREMLRPQVKVDESRSWSLGWQIYHDKGGDLIQHGGNNRGFHAFTSASLEGKWGFIIMTNGENGWPMITTPSLGEAMTRVVA
jgi:CubicO group peptidase (beta-lactamase class C family)